MFETQRENMSRDRSRTPCRGRQAILHVSVLIGYSTDELALLQLSSKATVGELRSLLAQLVGGGDFRLTSDDLKQAFLDAQELGDALRLASGTTLRLRAIW
eukprot:TRINITY_DN22968_c0_g1_i1.p1 TRINITY_DN22968_c0_g1~~TRINITY_DN22968_c0_g1_i1.p1  ORF type:complete len:101 (-),score=6.74 TRINITY_DN22968_c0_g1_i1:149-451(-)